MCYVFTSNPDRKAKHYLVLSSSRRFIPLTPGQSCQADVELCHLWPTAQLHYAGKCQADTCIHTVPLHYCFLHSAGEPKAHSPEEKSATYQKKMSESRRAYGMQQMNWFSAVPKQSLANTDPQRFCLLIKACSSTTQQHVTYDSFPLSGRRLKGTFESFIY